MKLHATRKARPIGNDHSQNGDTSGQSERFLPLAKLFKNSFPSRLFHSFFNKNKIYVYVLYRSDECCDKVILSAVAGRWHHSAGVSILLCVSYCEHSSKECVIFYNK